MNDQESIEWDESLMLEVEFDDPDTFLSIKETLTRIGIANNKTKSLYQSTHILHKRGRYYIVHFKELYCLDGKAHNLSVEDITRRNVISKLLEDWNLLRIVDKSSIDLDARCSLKVVKHADKSNWNLTPKYTISSDKK